MTIPIARWLTHNDSGKFAEQLVGASLAIIPDRAFHFPGPWIAQVRAAVPLIYVYTRLGHGPALADTNASQPAEWIEAQAIEAWGAYTGEAAWVGPNRVLAWYDTERVNPRTQMAPVKIEVLRPAWPHVDGIMWDFLYTPIVEWQREVIYATNAIAQLNGLNQRAYITNGRPGTYLGGRFLESMGRQLGWDTVPEALEETGFHNNDHLLILDLYRKPALRELAETMAMLRANTFVCDGRMRADGLVTT